MKMNLFCEECGCKLFPADNFCTGCGLFLDQAKEKAPSPVVTDPVMPTAASTQPKAVVDTRQVETSKPTGTTQPKQPIVQAPTVDAAAPKSSFLKISILSVVILALGAGAFFLLKGGLLKDAPKSSGGNASQKQGASGKSTPGVNITGQMLIDASIKGNVDELQGFLQQMKSRPPAPTLDRKQARSLNDEAIKAIRAQDYAEAIKLLKSAREADMADAEISNNLGFALRMAEDFKASESQLIKTIEQFPTRQQAWSDLGETSSKLGKHAQAVATFVTAHRLAKNPERLLEKYVKLMESTEDDALKTDLLEVTRLIEASN